MLNVVFKFIMIAILLNVVVLTKYDLQRLWPSNTMVEPLTGNPMIEGLNPTTFTRIEKMTKNMHFSGCGLATQR